jgi:hypothetical protein
VITTQDTLPSLVYDDSWGSIIDHPELDLLETRWYDTTVDLTPDQFKAWIARFAGLVEQLGRPRVLVDATSFRMNPAYTDPEWRDENIIPRYNKAGIRRFAFHMPPGMPAIGTTPKPEGPAEFPTGYFGTRSEALSWLTN